MNLPSPKSIESDSMTTVAQLPATMSRYPSSEPAELSSKHKQCLLTKTKIKTHFGKYPTLDDILSDKAPHPYSFSSFVGFLSQNHCLETVEFTMDVARYAEKYASGKSSRAELNKMWRRIVDAYIRVDGPKELNLPCDMRKRITGIGSRNNSTSSACTATSSASTATYSTLGSACSYTTPPSSYSSNSIADDEPPSPATLAPAVGLAKDMMKENAYIPFIASVKCSLPPSQAGELLHHHQLHHNNSSPNCIHASEMYSASSTECAQPCVSAPAASAEATTCNWRQPSSWSSRRMPAMSKSSSSESLYAGDEEDAFNTQGPMTPPESPQDYSSSGSCNYEPTSAPMSKSSSETGSRASNASFPQYVDQQQQQQEALSGPARSHWRKMSKRLKWRRGSDKEPKTPLPPTSINTPPTSMGY